VILRFVASLCVVCLAAAAHPLAQSDTPLIQDVAPLSVGQGCVMQVVGSRLVDSETDGTRLILVRDQQTIALAVRGFSRSLEGHVAGGRETITFGMPSTAMTGAWQLIVERDGHRSAPVTFHIVDWVPPTLHALSPEEAAPGQRVTLTGANFPTQLVNLRARVWRAGRSSPWSQEVAFDLLPFPADAVIHGIALVRGGNPIAAWSRIDASPPLAVPTNPYPFNPSGLEERLGCQCRADSFQRVSGGHHDVW
jgi:hypothetical protein